MMKQIIQSHHLQLTKILLALPMFMANANAGDYTVGLGAVTITTPYVSDTKNKTFAVPFFTYESERLHIGMDEISYAMFKDDDFKVLSKLALRSAEFNPLFYKSGTLDVKNKHLTGIKKRKIAIEAGLGISYMDLIQVSALHDMTNAHKGYEIDANAMLPLPLNDFIIMPMAGVSYQSKNLVNYQYGVNAQENVYQAKSTVTPYLGLFTIYPINKKVNFMIGGRYDFLNDTVKNSPIVDKDYTASAFSTLTYTF